MGVRFTAGNPGKPKGALNHNTRLVKDVFAEVFNSLQDDPKTSLQGWAKENQEEFYKLVTKLIPVQLDHAGEVVQRIIIEDAANCQPLKKVNDEEK